MAGKQLDVFISNGRIHFTSRSIECTENWDTEFNFDQDSNDETDFLETDIYEDFLTVILKEDIDYTTFSNDDYPGDAGAIHHERFTQL